MSCVAASATADLPTCLPVCLSADLHVRLVSWNISFPVKVYIFFVYMSVCLYTCMSVYMYVCMYLCLYVCMSVHVRWYISFSSALFLTELLFFFCVLGKSYIHNFLFFLCIKEGQAGAYHTYYTTFVSSLMSCNFGWIYSLVEMVFPLLKFIFLFLKWYFEFKVTFTQFWFKVGFWIEVKIPIFLVYSE